MPGPPATTSDHLETSSGGVGVDHLIDQRDEFIPHYDGVSDILVDNHANVEEVWTGNDSHLTAEETGNSQGGNTIISTIPPPNDRYDSGLHSGDRTVIFVGTRRLMMGELAILIYFSLQSDLEWLGSASPFKRVSLSQFRIDLLLFFSFHRKTPQFGHEKAILHHHLRRRNSFRLQSCWVCPGRTHFLVMFLFLHFTSRLTEYFEHRNVRT